MRQYWVRNTTNYDLILHDLRMAIPAQTAINVFQRRPSLTEEQVDKSRKDGKLAFCLACKPPKLIELPGAPPAGVKETTNEIHESMKPIPSRVKSSVVVNPRDKDVVEVMDEENMQLSNISAEKYANYADGFADPLTVDSEPATFKAVPLQELPKVQLLPAPENANIPRKAKGKAGKRGKSPTSTISPEDSE